MNYAGAGLILLSSDLTSTLLVCDARTNKWGFPKGHREPYDASDRDCAIRECHEETGLTTDDYVIHDEAFKISKGGQAYLFRYAVMKGECKKLRSCDAYEIGGLEWIQLSKLFEAQHIIDGNKYLRQWISDIKIKISKKSVNLFIGLLTSAAGLRPSHESMCSSNVITCS